MQVFCCLPFVVGVAAVADRSVRSGSVVHCVKYYAGISMLGPLESLPESELRYNFEVSLTS